MSRGSCWFLLGRLTSAASCHGPAKLETTLLASLLSPVGAADNGPEATDKAGLVLGCPVCIRWYGLDRQAFEHRSSQMRQYGISSRDCFPAVAHQAVRLPQEHAHNHATQGHGGMLTVQA